jgi:TatD DNase family protein
VTNLPSHFALAADRLRHSRFVTVALGIHPLFVEKGIRELATFKRMVKHVNFIGEIGLDFSRHGASTKSLQERVFEAILESFESRPRFVTLHSRGAEQAVLEGLRQHKVKQCVFHWFSGTLRALENILADGHFISINPSMIASAKGQQIINQAPKERILVESDGPFTKIDGRACKPTDIGIVYRTLAAQWKIKDAEAETLVESNFKRIVDSIGSSNS